MSFKRVLSSKSGLKTRFIFFGDLLHVRVNPYTFDEIWCTTTSRLCHGLVLSPRNVRSCGCLRMILRTRPRGHRPRFCSSVTSTPSFYSTIIPKSRRLSRRSILGVVVDSPPRTVSLSRRRLLPSHSLILTVSLRLPLCGIFRTHKVGHQLNIPTMSTPVLVTCCCVFMCCTEKVSQLINLPVMSLFDTPMIGTSTVWWSPIVSSWNFLKPQTAIVFQWWQI
jgi:hypothetical protein